jgi:hypothetical protein
MDNVQKHNNCINILPSQIFRSYLLNLILSSQLESSFRTFLLKVCVSSHNVCYIPTYLINLAFSRPNNIRDHLYSARLLIRQFSPPSCYFLFGPNILLSTLFSNTLSLCSSISARVQVSHPYKPTAKVTDVHTSLFTGTKSRRHRVYGPTCMLRRQSKGPVHSHQVRQCMHSMHDI